MSSLPPTRPPGTTGDPEVARLRELMLALYRQLGLLQREEICCHGVTVPQCYALQILARDGETTAGGLAGRLGVDASTMTRAADVLVGNGRVERVRPDEGDRRRVLLRLTAEGRSLARQLTEDGNACFRSLLDELPRGARGSVLDALGHLTAALDRRSCCRGGEPDGDSSCCS